MPMDRIQRVKMAVRHQSGAGIPTGELVMDKGFIEALLAWKGMNGADIPKSDIRLRIAGSRLLDHDLVCLHSEPIAPGRRNPLYPLEAIAEWLDEGLFVFWIVDGAFQRTMVHHDFMDFMRTLAASPGVVADEMARASLQVEALIEMGIGHGAHGIIIADDIAYRKDTYMAPSFGEQNLLPLWRRQVKTGMDLGAPVFFHSDGNINRFLPLIVEAGFDGLQCIEPAAGMDLLEIRKIYGTRLCLMGNIDPSLLCDPESLPHDGDASPRLERAVNDLIAAVGDSGGLLLGSCSGLHAGMSPERVCAMAALASQGKFPLHRTAQHGGDKVEMLLSGCLNPSDREF